MEQKKIYEDVFSNIYRNYGFGSGESRSGPGSELNETKVLREKIINLVKEKKIRSVVDIPCGDFNWMKEIVDNFDLYIGGDIVSECVIENNLNYGSNKIKFIKFDLVNDEIPECDLLIVRDVIGHQPIDVGVKMVKNILKSKCKYLLSTTWYNLYDKNYHILHENTGVDFGRFYPVNLMSDPFNFPEPDFVIEENVVVNDYENGNRKTLSFWDMDKIKNSIKISEIKKPNNNITLVTGLWDIGRGDLEKDWNRSYEFYLERFKQILSLEENMIIYGDTELQKFVFNHRKSHNTQFIVRNLDWFKTNEYYPLIQKIRSNPDWLNLSGWLQSSTQAKLELYNPLVMSKMFLLHDAKILDKFNSEYLFWIDAGLSNTVHPGYFTHDKVLDKLSKYISKFSFVCFPYNANNEIHGFEYNKLNLIAEDKVNKVARGGFFGGPKNSIPNINSIYYGLLLSSLQEGYMGTEESIFTIMTYKHSDLINYFEIDGNGLMGKFFEDLKNDNLKIKSENKNSPENNLSFNNVGLYVITFNSPKQFETLIQSMIEYDKNFIEKPKKFLLDNSTDLSTTPKYIELCEKYGFVHIKKDNLGICGGRQFIAEHAEEKNLDGYWFSEDDMFLQPKKGEVCKNGFPRYSENLYNKCIEIVKKENFDFLKINFTEFYGDNSTQWSWYNVPQNVREELFPEKTKLPVQGLDPNAPRTNFKNIKSYEGVPYATGEVYYCNWTHFITKEGNRKLFLETKWAHPYENTWMSFIYQETVKDNIKPGLLLMTPIEHNRFDHYARELRREN